MARMEFLVIHFLEKEGNLVYYLLIDQIVVQRVDCGTIIERLFKVILDFKLNISLCYSNNQYICGIKIILNFTNFISIFLPPKVDHDFQSN